MDRFIELAAPIISRSLTRNHIEFIENESNESHLWLIWWVDSSNWRRPSSRGHSPVVTLNSLKMNPMKSILTWHIHICDLTWHIHICDVTHSYVTHSYVYRGVRMCGMKSYMCETQLIYRYNSQSKGGQLSHTHTTTHCNTRCNTLHHTSLANRRSNGGKTTTHAHCEMLQHTLQHTSRN